MTDIQTGPNLPFLSSPGMISPDLVVRKPAQWYTTLDHIEIGTEKGHTYALNFPTLFNLIMKVDKAPILVLHSIQISQNES